MTQDPSFFVKTFHNSFSLRQHWYCWLNNKQFPPFLGRHLYCLGVFILKKRPHHVDLVWQHFVCFGFVLFCFVTVICIGKDTFYVAHCIYPHSASNDYYSIDNRKIIRKARSQINITMAMRYILYGCLKEEKAIEMVFTFIATHNPKTYGVAAAAFSHIIFSKCAGK